MESLKEFVKGIALPLDEENTRRTEQRKKYRNRGKLTSQILTACMIPVVAVVVAIFYIRGVMGHADNLALLGITDALIAVSSVFMILLCGLSYKFGAKVSVKKEVLVLSHTPKLIFMWIFGLCLLFLALLKFIETMDYVVRKTNQSAIFSSPRTIPFTLADIIFIITQLFFITYFSKRELKPSILLNIGMSFIVSCNISMWFYSTLSSFYRHAIRHYQPISKNETVSELTKFHNSILPFLAPMKTEFNLLIIGFLLTMWDTNNDGMLNTEEEFMGTTNSDTRNPHISRSLLSNPNACINQHPNEETELLADSILEETHDSIQGSAITPDRSDEDGRLGYGTMEKSTCNTTNSRNERSLYLSIIGGILMMVPYVTCCLILVKQKPEQLAFKFSFEVLRGIYIFICFGLLCMTLFQFRPSKTEELTDQRLREKQYILVVSTSGAVTFAALCLFAAVFSDTSSHTDHFKTGAIATIYIGQSLEIIVIFLQTILIIHSEHVVLICTSRSLEKRFVILGLLNFMFWVTDSFIIVSIDEDLVTGWIQTDFFTPQGWALIMETIFPFTIFYRFHSALEMYERFRHFRNEA